MLDYLLTWGGIYLPIGVVFFLLALEKDGGDLVAFILCGILFSFLGLMAMSKAWEYFEGCDPLLTLNEKKYSEVRVRIEYEMPDSTRCDVLWQDGFFC